MKWLRNHVLHYLSELRDLCEASPAPPQSSHNLRPYSAAGTPLRRNDPNDMARFSMPHVFPAVFQRDTQTQTKMPSGTPQSDIYPAVIGPPRPKHKKNNVENFGLKLNGLSELQYVFGTFFIDKNM